MNIDKSDNAAGTFGDIIIEINNMEKELKYLKKILICNLISLISTIIKIIIYII